MRFLSHSAIFNEIFDRKMSKSLNISPENYPCTMFGIDSQLKKGWLRSLFQIKLFGH